MAPEPREERPDDDSDETGTVADAYSPPAPEPGTGSSRFLLGVLAIVAVCLAVFVAVLLLR